MMRLHLFRALHPEGSHPRMLLPLSIDGYLYELMLPHCVAEPLVGAMKIGMWFRRDGPAYFSTADRDLEWLQQSTGSKTAVSVREFEPLEDDAGRLLPVALRRIVGTHEAALELLRIATQTTHFRSEMEEHFAPFARWFRCSGGFELISVLQLELPMPGPTSERRLLHDDRKIRFADLFRA
jgi:hypothetical protein